VFLLFVFIDFSMTLQNYSLFFEYPNVFRKSFEIIFEQAQTGAEKEPFDYSYYNITGLARPCNTR